jgi:hypothetical protein
MSPGDPVSQPWGQQTFAQSHKIPFSAVSGCIGLQAQIRENPNGEVVLIKIKESTKHV